MLKLSAGAPLRALRLILLALPLALIGACSTTYKPVAIDPRSGLYDTMTNVDPGGVMPGRQRVRPDEFAAVLLIADSNKYPSRLEFTTRRALADLGFKRVINVEEFRAWASDAKFELPADKLNSQLIKDFSNQVRPLLLLDVRYGHLGDTQHFAGLRLVDGRTLQSLLTVNHPKGVWLSVDEEIIYPVLNELRRWHRQMLTPAA